MSFKTEDGQAPTARLSLRQAILRIVIISAAYFFAHYLAFLFADSKQVIMPIWPAGGVGLAALLLNPRRLWPAIIVSLYVAGISADVFLADRSFLASVGYMTGNAVESLGCAGLIVCWCGWDVRFARVKEVLALIAGAIVVNAFSASIGAGTATLVHSASFGESWLSWYVSDGLGILLIAPFIVSWADFRGLLDGVRWSRVAESALFMAVWCATTWLSFQTQSNYHPYSPHPYMLVALLAWPAFRGGQRGITLALVVMVGIAITGETVTAGPLLWGGESVSERLLATQVFVGFIAVAGFLLAASYNETNSSEQALRRSEALLRSSQAIAHLGSWELDIATNRLTWSDEVYHIFGLHPQESGATYNTFLEAVHPADRDQVDAAYWGSLREGSDLYEIQHRVVQRDTSEIRHVQEKCEHVKDATGKIVRSVGMVQDITERKRAAEELARHRDHLEELVQERTRELGESRAKLHRAERLASLGTLAAGIAHEINNPLGMMLLGTDMALRSLDDSIKLADLLHKQKGDLERCARIVKGVLDFTRQRSTEKWPLNLNEIARRSRDFTQEYAKKQGVTVEAGLTDSLGPILGNATELEQVVVNLIHNAVQACGAGGHVRIETSATDDKVRLLVRDNGCGMTREEIEHIFDPFYTTRLEKGGTGLGLSTVHGIVTSHGGTIDVSSERGKGTIFTIEFSRYTETEVRVGEDFSG